jgi:hypothetical protein
MNRQQRADERSRVFHVEIAAKLRAHPELWDIPRQNLQRWEHKMHGLPPALREWRRILQTMPHEKVLSLLESPSEEATRLRSSTPFTGILTQAERQRLFETCTQS